MALKIIFFEDNKYNQFYPLTHLRPIYTLRSGILPFYRRIDKYFKDYSFILTCREQIAALTSEKFKDVPVNIIKKEPETELLFLNGRIRDYGEIPAGVIEAKQSTFFHAGDEIAAILMKHDTLKYLSSVNTIKEYNDYLNTEIDNIHHVHTKATLYNYCWDIMADIEKEVTNDFNWLSNKFRNSDNLKIHDGVFIEAKDNIYLGTNVEILPGSVLDASNGPIFIGDNCKIDAHAAIYGPTVIGPNCMVLAGKISSSSIGHTSRVGGEVEWTVFQSYVNKYHDGFIGHSYVGSWVNFGAMTTNSDLKNNYSNIRTRLNGKAVDTQSNKVGSFIGDHTKFGIGTLLNTGINIGICCNLFGGTLITDKEINSFSWGMSGNYKKYDVDKAIETAGIVCERRNTHLSEREVEILRLVSDGQDEPEGILNL